MTTQIQDIKDRLSKIESDTAEARKMLEKAETGAKSAESWRPKLGDVVFCVMHDGLKWACRNFRYYSVPWKDELVAAGNSFRTEAEALEVATQRQFITEYISAGDLAPTEKNAYTMWAYSDNELDYICSRFPTLERKFSTRELLNAFIEKWGGEKAVDERLSKGWR